MIDAHPYRISYFDETGKACSRRVEARSEEEAVRQLGVMRSRIRSVKVDKFSEIMQVMNRDAPSLDVQASILNVFSAQIGSGQNAPQTFDRICNGYRKFQSKMDAVRRNSRISEKMRLLQFEPQLVMLAEVGEQSGQLDTVLAGAADELIEQQRIRSLIMTSLVPSILIALVGLAVMIGLPMFLFDSITNIMESPGINFKSNLSTHFLLFMGENVPIYWVHSIFVAVALFLFRGVLWEAIKGLPLASMIEEFKRIGIAYRFIAGFTPLVARGMRVIDALELIEKHATGRLKKAYREVIDHISAGGSVSTAFESDMWHRTLRECMRGYDQVRDADRVHLLERIKPLLANQLNRVVFRMNTVFGGIGLVLSVGVVLVVFFGMMLPLLTISVS